MSRVRIHSSTVDSGSFPAFESARTLTPYLTLANAQVDLLRDILREWAREVEKKPPNMTKEECMAVLGLPSNTVYEEGCVGNCDMVCLNTREKRGGSVLGVSLLIVHGCAGFAHQHRL